MSSPSIRHIADFSDKLNPMLVKELRQGLRGISFVILFIALQAFLALILLTTAAGASYQNAGHLLSRIIFFFFSVAILIVQPLRGVSALSTEIKGNTIDLLCLTRLSAWRITFGKWVSIVSQSALILTAIVPYLILRYFFGDMRIFSELLLVFSIFLLSAVFTAITVGLSSVSSIIIRVLLPIIASFYVFGGIWTSFVGGRYSYQTILDLVTLNNGPSTLIYLGFVTACIYATWLCLDLGTSKIAPVSENRATPKRLISLILIGITIAALALAKVDLAVICAVGMLLSAPICFFSLTENPQLVPPIAAPFVRKGILGKLAGRFLYPGWATGLLFVFLLYLTFQLIFLISPPPAHDGRQELLAGINSFFAMMLMALALTQLIARKNPNKMGLFLLFVTSQVLILALIKAIQQWYPKTELLTYFCWVPTTFDSLSEKNRFTEGQIVFISYFNVVLYFSISLVTSLPVWKQIRQVEQSIAPH